MEATDEQQEKSPFIQPRKKAGRKKVAKSRRVKRVKERGKYSRNVIGEGDSDLADCLFSDEEMRTEFQAAQNSSVASSDASDKSLLLALSHESTPSTSIIDSDSSRPSSSLSSRPPSVLSRPSSGMDHVDNVDISTSLQGAEVLSTAEQVAVIPSLELIELGLQKFRSILPSPWVPIASAEGFHLLLLSRKTPITVQREVYISHGGNVNIIMHCRVVPSFRSIFNLESQPLIQFNEESLQQFCDTSLQLVKTFLQYDVCIGMNDMETRDVWDKAQCEIDSNPYQCEKYTETCRSLTCLWIVQLGKGKRCQECAKMKKTFLKRKEFLLSSTANPLTNNKNLTQQQALNKLEALQKEIKKKEKKIAYLQSRIVSVLDAEGVNVDEDLNESFSRILLASDQLTDLQKMFLQEQWSSAHKGNSHRWHPAMIRMALSVYMRGSGNYNSTRDLGIMRLPHSRTLFDYAHSIKATDGVNDEIVNLVYSRVQELDPENNPHKELHVLLCDSMHISQNLVYKVSDGGLVGFVHLDNVDKELEKLENYIQGQEPIKNQQILASEVLAYMVKGMASDVKCVVASYPMKVLSKEQLYKRTWDVIRHLETAGIKVLCFICDGHPVHRAFFNMHVPYTTDTKFNAIFDTVNLCASEFRLLYFISDVCHLLKTLRNSFYNSGEGPKKPRLLLLNGEKIMWKQIIRLYFTYKNHNFRKSYKLSAFNVFPNSYSKMKVLPAAQVLSNTVAQDIEDQKWADTQETVKFIRLCNRFFDCLNGAHTAQGKRQNKPDVFPYTVENINYELTEGRFKFLRGFVDYLADWRAQVNRMPLPSEKKQKMMLPLQTMVGIETSIRAIEAATCFFLNPLEGKGKFVNARIFSQDPLEQHFGVQRTGGGGSRNPNVSQFQEKQVCTALQRGINIKLRKGNSAEGDVAMEMSSGTVPKRARYGKK